MSNVNVLPDMDEPRLKTLGKQLNRNRKWSLIHHDKLKGTLGTLERSLNKEQRSVNGKYFRMGVQLKKNLAHVRGTQKCLRVKREQSFWEDTDEYPYGVYDGESLNSYRREIENIIDKKHPRVRRMKKVEQYLKDGRANGRLLKNNEAIANFDTIMTKPKFTDSSSRTRYRNSPITKNMLRRVHDRNVLDHSPTRVSSNSPRLTSRLSTLKLDDMNDLPSGAASPSSRSSSQSVRAALTLPPITADRRTADSRRMNRVSESDTSEVFRSPQKQTQSMYMKTGNGSKLTIRRMSKAESSNNDLAPDLKRLRNRRATSYVT